MAAIDLGSNSFYLQIAKCLAHHDYELIESYKERVQLREGLQDDGKLSQAACDRALACFKKFRSVLDHYRVERLRVVGTYTLRAATDCGAFLKQAEGILGQPIDIISGEEEARLIYVGAMSKGIILEPHLVLDIGGGSTELILGEAGVLKQAVSLTLGCLEYQLKFFKEGLMTPERFNLAIQAALHTILPVVDLFAFPPFKRCLGGSGTLRELLNIVGEGSQSKPDCLSASDLDILQDQLIAFGDVKSMKVAGLREDRHNVIAGGLSILIALFKAFNISEIELSKGAIREGILFELSKS